MRKYGEGCLYADLIPYDKTLQIRGLAISILSEREQLVLTWRYGLDGRQPQTLREIGRRLDLTGERIRMIQAKALRTLGERKREKKT